MKTVKTTQSFKAVRATQVARFPELQDRLGKKRASVEFEVPEYEKSDLPTLVDTKPDLLLSCLNRALEQLAKDQFAANQSDWSFAPSLESLTLDALEASFESASRGRVLTLESAGKLVAWMLRNAGKIVGGIQAVDASYKEAQFQAACSVVAKFTAYESKGAEFSGKILQRLEQISDAISEDEELGAAFVEEPELVNVFDALIKKFSKAAEAEEIGVDAL